MLQWRLVILQIHNNNIELHKSDPGQQTFCRDTLITNNRSNYYLYLICAHAGFEMNVPTSDNRSTRVIEVIKYNEYSSHA